VAQSYMGNGVVVKKNYVLLHELTTVKYDEARAYRKKTGSYPRVRDEKIILISHKIYIGFYRLGNGKSGKWKNTIRCLRVVHFVMFCCIIVFSALV